VAHGAEGGGHAVGDRVGRVVGAEAQVGTKEAHRHAGGGLRFGERHCGRQALELARGAVVGLAEDRDRCLLTIVGNDARIVIETGVDDLWKLATACRDAVKRREEERRSEEASQRIMEAARRRDEEERRLTPEQRQRRIERIRAEQQRYCERLEAQTELIRQAQARKAQALARGDSEGARAAAEEEVAATVRLREVRMEWARGKEDRERMS
jgi:hypothetical protein